MNVQIGIIGASCSDEDLDRLAEEIGMLVGRKKWVLICGGLGGVMEAAARGARKVGGLTIGILPGPDKHSANPYIDVALPTDMGHARNALIAGASDALVAVGGGYGTLSEIALARKMGKMVVSLRSWDLTEDIPSVQKAEEALSMIETSLESGSRDPLV